MTTNRSQRRRDADARREARIAELLAKAPPISEQRMIRLRALMPPVVTPPDVSADEPANDDG
jgi:hypothetical protein